MERSRSFLLQHSKPSRINTFTTVIVLGGIILAFLFAYLAFGDDSDDATLKYISIVFRHGDKTPTSTYANDPYKEATLWPEGWGQLTNKGKKQMFQLGQFLHSRYGRFLGPYSHQTVRVDSSDHDRCHQSAGALLAALFPPQGAQVWNKELLWQPVPIHAAPREADKLITTTAPCPLYEDEKKRSDKILSASYDKQNANLYRYLSEHSGENVTKLIDVESLFNILEIEENSGKTLPEWTKSVFPDKMKDIAALVLASFTYTTVMKKIKGGPLIGDFIKNMESQTSGLSKQKLSLYAAHDLVIVSVRRALGFDDLTFKPDLGAALIMELRVLGGNPLVELYYLDSYAASTPDRWEIPGCSSPCSLSMFTDAMKSVIPAEWDVECQSREQS